MLAQEWTRPPRTDSILAYGRHGWSTAIIAYGQRGLPCGRVNVGTPHGTGNVTDKVKTMPLTQA